jgi:hypothetical protein
MATLVIGACGSGTNSTFDAGTTDGAILSPDADFSLALESLEVSPGMLEPAFDPSITSYRVLLGLGVEFATVTPTASRPDDVSIHLNGFAVESGSVSSPIALALGDNEVTLTLSNAGAVQRSYTIVFSRGSGLLQGAYLKASNTERYDRFGAALALSGNTLVVSSYHEDSADIGVGIDETGGFSQDSGAVYVFASDGSAWSQQAYVKASNTGPLDEFGYSVALDGDTLAVGAPLEASAATAIDGDQTDDSTPYAGAVYVFARDGVTWSQRAYIKASNTGANDRFGNAVTVSGDTLVVGAPGEGSAAKGVGGDQADDTAPQSGAAYVFVRSGDVWTQQAYIKASNTDPSDLFGVRVALDGDTLVVSAVGETSAARGVGGDETDNSAWLAGAAYVFFRTAGEWEQQAYIKASNTERLDRFGRSVAISGDTVAVGSLDEGSAATGIDGDDTDNSAPGSGAVYVFSRVGASWTQSAYIKASNTDRYDSFGSSVSIEGDALVVGAAGEESAATGVGGDQADDTESAGAAYLFVRTADVWSQVAYIKASNTGPGDGFGETAAVSKATVAIGASFERSTATGIDGDESDNAAEWAGAVYVFQ